MTAYCPCCGSADRPGSRCAPCGQRRETMRDLNHPWGPKWDYFESARPRVEERAANAPPSTVPFLVLRAATRHAHALVRYFDPLVPAQSKKAANRLRAAHIISWKGAAPALDLRGASWASALAAQARREEELAEELDRDGYEARRLEVD